LIAHGSASAVAVGGGGAAGGGAAGRGVVGTALLTVGSGVIEAVESLDPQPESASAAAVITTALFTTGHRTGIAWDGRSGARRVIRLPATRL
jgi:hypothetical protein